MDFCEVINAHRISEVENPLHGFNYNIQILTSVDNGKTWFYSGVGQYVKTLKDAENVARYYNTQPLEGARA